MSKQKLIKKGLKKEVDVQSKKIDLLYDQIKRLEEQNIDLTYSNQQL
jgi:Cu/Ag efflux protein CusF